MVGMILARQPWPTAYPQGHGVEGTGSWGSDQGNCSPSVRARVQLGAEIQTPSSVLDARVGAIWLENALPQHDDFKPAWEEMRECGSPPCQQQPPQPAIGPSHSHPNLGSRLASMRTDQWTGL